jgi:L-lactate dehydrogenase complex protein LldG
MAEFENSGQGARTAILERIRAALCTPAPHHEAPPDLQAPFAPVENPLERFLTECAGNLIECIVTANHAASAAELAKLLASLPAGEVFVQDAPELRVLISAAVNGRPLRWSSEGAPAENSQATVTLAEALVAQTGSIMVSSGCGGRGASIVPPTHIVCAKLTQLVPDIETALARAQESGLIASHSYVGLITGSSRTADIEKILVLGAHGPRRLVVLLQTNP